MLLWLGSLLVLDGVRGPASGPKPRSQHANYPTNYQGAAVSGEWCTKRPQGASGEVAKTGARRERESRQPERGALTECPSFLFFIFVALAAIGVRGPASGPKPRSQHANYPTNYQGAAVSGE